MVAVWDRSYFAEPRLFHLVDNRGRIGEHTAEPWLLHSGDGCLHHRRQPEGLTDKEKAAPRQIGARLLFYVYSTSSSSGSEDISTRMISLYSRSGFLRKRSASSWAISSRGMASRRSMTLPISSSRARDTV